MSKTSVAHPAHPSPVPEPVRERVERGRRLFEERGDLIEHEGRGVYRVPSCAGKRSYKVDLALFGGEEACSCPDAKRGHICKHLVAASIHRARVVATRPAARFVKGVVPELTDLDRLPVAL